MTTTSEKYKDISLFSFAKRNMKEFSFDELELISDVQEGRTQTLIIMLDTYIEHTRSRLNHDEHICDLVEMLKESIFECGAARYQQIAKRHGDVKHNHSN